MKWSQSLLSFFDNTLHQLNLLQDGEKSQVEDIDVDPKIPEEYLERFSLKPSTEAESLLGREADVGLVEQALRNWEVEGHPLLIISEPGMGMTSFLNAVQNKFPKVSRLDENYRIQDRPELRRVLSRLLGVKMEDDATSIADKLPDEPRTVIFENVERLYLRKPYGFDRLRDLIKFMALTRKKIFWVVTVNRFTIYYLDRVMDFTTNFPSRIMLKPFDSETVEKILNRQTEGLDLVFLKPDQLPTLIGRQFRRARDKEKKQQILRNHFMRSLHAYAQGNISRAFLYFRQSLRGVRENRIYAKAYPHKIPNTPEIENLLVLEAVLQHSSLSIPDLAQVLRKPEHYALQRVTYLGEEGWLIPQAVRKGPLEHQINLDNLYEVKNQIHDKLNRKSY